MASVGSDAFAALRTSFIVMLRTRAVISFSFFMIMTIPFRYASRHKTVTKEYAPDVAKQSLLK